MIRSSVFILMEKKTPRFSLHLSEFGEKEPFIKPLAESYIGPFDNGRGPIRVARSFVPMPFNKGCRVTTDVKLEGYERTKGEGVGTCCISHLCGQWYQDLYREGEL